MASETIIYHNPRCSKSRASLALLEQNNIEPQIVEYLKNTPDKETLQRVISLLGCSPRDIIRTGQSEYRENQLDNPELSDEQLINAMLEHPILIERPIIIQGDKAVIGRPPENVLQLL